MTTQQITWGGGEVHSALIKDVRGHLVLAVLGGFGRYVLEPKGSAAIAVGPHVYRWHRIDVFAADARIGVADAGDDPPRMFSVFRYFDEARWTAQRRLGAQYKAECPFEAAARLIVAEGAAMTKEE